MARPQMSINAPMMSQVVNTGSADLGRCVDGSIGPETGHLGAEAGQLCVDVGRAVG